MRVDSDSPKSGIFSFEQALSENEFAQSWLAIDKKSGHRYFVKVSKDDTLGRNDTISVLDRSFNLQRLLRSSQVLTSIRKLSENNRIFIQYPLLDRDKWRTLAPEIFWRHFPGPLLEIFTIIDYLHLYGLVHCDLKFENFQVDGSGDGPRIILIDLDFLTKSHTSPAFKIFGTPEHIAPEILNNQEVLIESDNYSIGIALKEYLKVYGEYPNLDSAGKKGIENRLGALIKELTSLDPFQRPMSLITALSKSGIIDKKASDSAQKKLLGMKLLTDFRNYKRRAGHDADTVREIISPQNGIFGLADELLNLLSSEMKTRPHHSLRVFMALIGSSEVERFGNYWHINVTDEAVWDAFRELNWADYNVGGFRRTNSDGQLKDERSVVNSVLAGERNDEAYPSFLALKFAYAAIKESPDVENKNLYRQILKKLVELSQILGRYHDVEDFIAAAIKDDPEDALEKCQLLYDLSHIQLLIGKTGRFVETVSAGTALCEKLGDEKFYRIFRRQEAWLLAARGDFEKADLLLSDLLEKALKEERFAEASKILTTRASIFWRSGKFVMAIDFLNKALNYAKKYGDKVDLIILYSNLALLYSETGSYTRSIKFGKQAAEIAEASQQQKTRLSGIYVNLTNSYSRLADYDRAEYCLNKYLCGKVLGLDKTYFQNYNLYYGSLLFKKGQLQEARETFYHLLSLNTFEEKDRNLGKLYQSMALLALHMGSDTEFSKFIGKARDVFREIKDTTSLLEIDFIDAIHGVYIRPSNEVDRLIDICNQFIVGNNYLYAALGHFYILLFGSDAAQKKASADSARFSFLNIEPEVPLFKAVMELKEADNLKNSGNPEFVRHLKNAYRVLNNSGDRYNSLLLCLRIGDIYRMTGIFKLAKKFFQQASISAQAIGHTALKEISNQRLLELPDHGQDHNHFVMSLHEISDILDHIDDRDLSLSKLVRYAVNETGAERGVLLMRADPQSELMVKMVVNCDADCLDDIRQFSNSVVNAVALQRTPLIIDNAMKDDRTKKFKSIMSYNILSVICVPIRQNEFLKGVLYLDHHTIPALFEMEDVTFIHAIANFISILLRTVSDYGNHVSLNKQLTDDLQKFGGSQVFITQNETMRLLFSKLPDIAKSNASILLVGASGTGKEILGQMIHDQSLRAGKPMIKLNCAAISASLIESELFGVAKNAATGVDERDGKLWAADGGTLFFDEIGDMPFEIQSKILRVIEYQRFEKVGSNRVVSTDIRFIYATNRNLKDLINQGKFREDLFYRINTVTIHVPPLSERADDIPLLLIHFSKIFSPDENRRPFFSASSMNALLSYPWPGNVRELRNFIEKYCIYYPGKNVDFSDLPPEIRNHFELAADNSEKAENIEKAKIRELLFNFKWNQSAVARRIGIPLSTLRRKIKKYHIYKNLP